MAGPYVDGAAILLHAGQTAPSAADTDWANTVAAAIESTIARRLNGYTTTTDQDAELMRAALQDGAAAYIERKAPHGVLSVGPEGSDTVRLGRNVARALEPVFVSIAGYGIG
jgi:hypothetical protein